MRTPRTLRSSCRYCRRRKIRCDGASPCSACRERDIDCIHDQQARMGRPPAKDQSQPSSSAVTVSLGTVLDTAFDDIFVSEVPTTAFSAAVKTYLTQNVDAFVLDATDLAEQQPCTPAVYFALWPQLLRDVMDACQLHYCPQLRRSGSASQKRPRYLPVSLRMDVARTMACTANCGDKTVADVTGRELEQIFHTWSAIHPLAPCVAIEDLSGYTAVSRALRSLVICEAMEVAGGAEAFDSQKHFDYALFALRSQGIPIYDDAENVLSTVTTLLHTCQSALLFGWRALSHNQARHGTAYMAAAGQVMGRMQTLAVGHSASLPTALLDRVRTASSLFALTTVWAFSQLDRSTGDLGFALQLPDSPRNSARAFDEALALYSSALLNAHPNVLSGAVADERGTADVQDIVSRQLAWIDSQRLHSNGEDDALQALHDTFRLILISAKSASQTAEVIPAFLATARTAAVRMKSLAGSKNESLNRPVLSRMAFRPPAKVDETESRVKKTLAAYLFELLAAMLESFSRHMTAEDIQELCSTLQDAQLDVVETETFSFAKAQIESVASSTMNGMGNVSTASSLSSSTFSSPFVTDVSTAETTPTDQEEEMDLYSTLWGFVPWSDEGSEARYGWNKG